MSEASAKTVERESVKQLHDNTAKVTTDQGKNTEALMHQDTVIENNNNNNNNNKKRIIIRKVMNRNSTRNGAGGKGEGAA